MANLFISHRISDNKEAEILANHLREAGHNVWLDLWKIDVGDSIVEQMNIGLEGSTHLILCYSKNGIDSQWMSREWLSTLSRQLDGKGVKVIPVQLTGGKPPAILADIKYADLVKDYAYGLSEILKAIK